MNKEGISKRNVIEFSFIFILAVSVIFMFSFVVADTTFRLNITNQSGPGGQVNFTRSTSSASDVSSVINAFMQEDVQSIFNFSFSHLAGTKNLTGVNITLPTGFVFKDGSNKSFNFTTAPSESTIFFNWTNITSSSQGQYTIFWNTTGATGAIIHTNGTNNATYLSFNVTALDPGKHNITIRYIYNRTNTLGDLVYNETRIQVTVNDSNKPQVYALNLTILGSDDKLSNNTVADYHKGSVTLNVTVIDNGVLNVYFNLTNSSGHSNTTWFYRATNSSTSNDRVWNYTLDTTLLPDGNYTIIAQVNDTGKNLNNTATFNFTIDNTAPTGTMTCSPVDSYVGTLLTCTCSPSDTTSGLSSTTYTASPSTTNAGNDLTQTCTAVDKAGNSGTITSNQYDIWGTPSGSTGPSGGTTTTTPTTKTTTIGEIVPETPRVITTLDGTTFVKEITVEVSSTATNVQVTVNKYESKPAAVSVEVSNAYKYLQINTQNLADKLSKAIVKTYVEKSWVTSQGIAKEDVALFKYDETANQWNELATTYDSEDANYYYYTTEVTSFSYFAIAPQAVTTTGGEEPVPETEQPTTATGLLGLPIWAWIVIGLIILAAIIGGGVVLGKKKRR